MEFDKYQTLHAHVLRTNSGVASDGWRRHCGCLKTSDKLKELLKSFPSPPPPPSPADEDALKDPERNPFDVNCVTVTKCVYPSFGPHNDCISTYCTHNRTSNRPSTPNMLELRDREQTEEALEEQVMKKSIRRRSWNIIADLVQLVQLSVTATALALYYLIYCYMQLVYYTLRSALYFHNADGPMKVTIGVVTITSVIVGFNLLIRMERLIGVF